MPAGTFVGGKMHAALRKLGFDLIWDNEHTTDLTIMEVGTELINRITKPDAKHPLPQFTSCCPGWVKFVESFYPEILPHVSTCRSPIAMLGSLAKTYGAKQIKTDPKNMYTVSIMPCVAQKYEGLRPEMNASGFRDIDATITTRELAYIIRQAGIDFASLPDEDADPILGETTCGETTNAATFSICIRGDLILRVLRLAYEALSGNKLKRRDIEGEYTNEGIETGTVDVPGFGPINFTVAIGLENAAKLCKEVNIGESKHHFIEVMTCPGGCVNGSGQPLDPGARIGHAGLGILNAYKKRFGISC
jgi:ferredoxin hydrogenase large subunit